MAKVERVREVVSAPPTEEFIRLKTDAGWKLVAVEWERETSREEQGTGVLSGEVPFGLKVGSDCVTLEEEHTEKLILLRTMELIVLDKNLTQVADELNAQGFRTRQGVKWSPVSVFNLLPRLIEVGPRILSSEDWAVRRQRLFDLV
ncbi:MAG: recombinase family protein [Acidobacteriia bacterium]|nr:recombinase family protein [Terriglobia bacterium]